MFNINPGHNRGLMDSCKTLGDYSEYVATSVTSVFQEPATSVGGWFTSGWCADRANQVFLSSTVPAKELKYDPGAPTAGLSFHRETMTFTDISTDGLSGVNPARTGILFRTVGGAAPAASDADWQSLASYTVHAKIKEFVRLTSH